MAKGGGTCAVCNETVPTRRMEAHVMGHFDKGGSGSAFLVEAIGGGPYRLYARVTGRAKLSDLDGLLRKVWVECCDHLSSFSDGNLTYLSMKSGMDDPDERTMGANAARVLGDRGDLLYTYDFGTSTTLQVRLVDVCSGAGMKKPVELVARNAEIKYDCSEGGSEGAAEEICGECAWDGEGAGLLCAACAKKHEHGDEDSYLPVVNSPRMGTCGYTG